jgi:hypothetical protein
VYRASAVLTLQVGLLRRALHAWPLTTAALGIGSLFTALCAAAGAALAARQALPLLRGDAAAPAAPHAPSHWPPASPPRGLLAPATAAAARRGELLLLSGTEEEGGSDQDALNQSEEEDDADADLSSSDAGDDASGGTGSAAARDAEAEAEAALLRGDGLRLRRSGSLLRDA